MSRGSRGRNHVSYRWRWTWRHVVGTLSPGRHTYELQSTIPIDSHFRPECSTWKRHSSVNPARRSMLCDCLYFAPSFVRRPCVANRITIDIGIYSVAGETLALILNVFVTWQAGWRHGTPANRNSSLLWLRAKLFKYLSGIHREKWLTPDKRNVSLLSRVDSRGGNRNR